MDRAPADGTDLIEEVPGEGAGPRVLTDCVDRVAVLARGGDGVLYAESPTALVLADAAGGRVLVRREVEDPMRELDRGAYTGVGRLVVDPALGQLAAGDPSIGGTPGRVVESGTARTVFLVPVRLDVPVGFPDQTPDGPARWLDRAPYEGR